jgi:hypothetical protein
MSYPQNPFAVLGVPEFPDLDDETVRAAWRAIAAATHPGREDGGDLPRYTQACAAFAQLNTPWARSEAYADLVEQAWQQGHTDDDYPEGYPRGWPGDQPAPPEPGPQPVPIRDALRMAARYLAAIPARARHGHPARLLLRAAVTAALCAAALALIGNPALAQYAALTLIITFAVLARQDLAPPPRPQARNPAKRQER